ncbi:hypothetical protein MBLNU457_5746t1 [Dothideomycetes sp. NU457]
MRYPVAALPLLAGLSLVDAQLNFAPVVKVAPQITTNTPYTTHTSSVNTVATASSILSSLSSAHDSSVEATATQAPITTSAKATPTGKKKKHPKKKHPKKKHPKKHHARDVVLEKRATTTSTVAQVCTQTNPIYMQPTYTSTPNTPSGFLLDQSLANQAAAQWLPPAGYWTSFQNSFGANWQLTNTVAGVVYPGDVYRGDRLPGAYNTTLCAIVCNNDPGCLGFNIYFEREPTYVPNNTTCRNPAAAVDVHCAFYNQPIFNASTTNYGLYEDDFYVVIQGSNGYNKLAPWSPVANFSGPTNMVAAVNPNNAQQYLMAQNFYSTYDPSQCGQFCTSTTQANRQQAIANGFSTYPACNYYNIFNLTYGASVGNQGTNYGMYCQIFTSTAASNYATLNAASYQGVNYNLTGSAGYTLYPLDQGSTATTWAPAPTGSAAACSSLGSVGSTLVDYNGANYTLACGYDVSYTQVSADIGNAPAPDFYSCFNLCDNYAGCSAFSYYQGICYFKNLTGGTVTPQYNPSGQVDFAYLTNKYAGFGASTIGATVTYTTYTAAWTGAATTTTTSVNGLNGYVIVETPGGKAPTGVQTITSAVDRGTATTISSTVLPTSSGASVVTVVKYYPTPVTTCGNAGIKFAGYSNTAPGGQNTANYPAFTPEGYKTVKPTIYATPTVTTFTTTTAYPTSTVSSTVYTTTGGCGPFYPWWYVCQYYQTSYSTSTFTTTSTATVTSTTRPTLAPTGITNYLGEYNAGSAGITVYGDQNVDGTTLVLDHTFYLFAGRGTGYYGFSIPYVDDATFVWFGQKAVSGWTRANADISQFWPNNNAVSLAYYLNLGSYMPVRIMWGNGGSTGSLQFNVFGPDGSLMLASTPNTNTGYMSPDIVTSPCNSTLGAAFPAWGAET